MTHPGSVCVQIGPLGAPKENQGQCYQLVLPGQKEHIEPLPLDEFGYLYPPLKPEPKLAPLAVSAPAPAVAAIAPLTVPAATAMPPAAVITRPAPQFTIQTVRFSTPVPFKLNSAHLAHTNRAAVTAFVNSLERYRGVEDIRITGHTDASGSLRFNQWLSRMRAQSVRLHLLALGADPRHIHIRGVGSREPRPHARAAADNRYVDIQVKVRVPGQ